MRNILSDSSKFSQVSVTEDKQSNFIVNVEKHITDVLKNLEKSEVISETVYKRLKPTSSRLGILYGLSKVHKQLVNKSLSISLHELILIKDRTSPPLYFCD